MAIQNWIDAESSSCKAQFYWWRDGASGTTSTINWTITVTTPDDDPYYYAGGSVNRIQISNGSGTVTSGSGTFYYGNSYQSISSGEVVKRGTFTLQHPSATSAATFNIRIYFTEQSGGQGIGADSMTGDAVEAYSKCSAPTNVSVNAAYIKPNGSFKLDWSGAAGGTSNSITGYKIYWRASSNGAEPTTTNYTGTADVASTSTSGNYTINFSNNQQTRGYKVVCKVVTKGSAGSSYYSNLSAAATTTINIKPTAPVIKIGSSDYTNETYKFKSTEQTNSILVKASTSSPETGQKASVYYYKVNSEQDYNNPPSFPSDGLNLGIGTYYFWGKDECGEWSDRSQLIISKNTKPIINSVTGKPVLQQVFGWGAGSWTNEKYCIGIAEKITPTINCNKTGTIKVVVEMQRATIYTTQFAVATTDSLSNFTLNKSGTNVSMGEYNVCSSITKKYGVLASSYDNSGSGATFTNYYYYRWRLKFILNDGFEDSAGVYFPNNEKQYYALAGAGSFSNGSSKTGPASNKVYNQFEDFNITGSTGKICRKIRLKMQIDDSINDYSINVQINGTKYNYTPANPTPTISGTYKILDITLSKAPPSNADITITVIQTNTAKTITKQSIYIAKTRLLPSVPSAGTCGAGTDSSISRITTIKPFDATRIETYEVWEGNPFDGRTGTGTDFEQILTDYDITTDKIKVMISCNEKTSSLSPKADSSGGPIILTQSYLTLRLDTREVFDFNTRVYGITNRIGIYKANLYIRITNYYGENIDSVPTEIDLDFNKSISVTFNKLEISRDNSTWYDFDNLVNSIQEGLYYRFNYNYTAYSSPDTIVTQLLMKNGESFTILNSEPTQITQITTTREGQSGQISIITNRISEINKLLTNNKINFKAKFTNAGLTTETNEISYNGLLHTAPTFKLNSLTGSKTEINYDCSITNFGFGTNNSNTSVFIYFLDGNYKRYTDNIPISNVGTKTGTVAFSTSPNTSLDLGFKIVTKRTQTINKETYTLTKSFISNYKFVQIEAPTIAYRKNAVGINTSNIDENSVLQIYATENRKQIKLYDTTQSYFLIDLSKGTIDYIS